MNQFYHTPKNSFEEFWCNNLASSCFYSTWASKTSNEVEYYNFPINPWMTPGGFIQCRKTQERKRKQVESGHVGCRPKAKLGRFSSESSRAVNDMNLLRKWQQWLIPLSLQTSPLQLQVSSSFLSMFVVYALTDWLFLLSHGPKLILNFNFF